MTEIDVTENELYSDVPLNDDNNENHGASYWSQDKLAVVMAVILVVAGFGFLILIFLPLLAILLGLVGIEFPILEEALAWLGSGSRGWILAAVLAIVALLTYVLLRTRILRNTSLYAGAGCPYCGESEFIRVRRTNGDRLLAKLGIPVRRYVCRNCSWGGLRIGRQMPGTENPYETLPPDLAIASKANVQKLESPDAEW